MNKYANLLEGMARAVEEAYVILICFSEQYRNSQNCRTGIRYNYQLNLYNNYYPAIFVNYIYHVPNSLLHVVKLENMTFPRNENFYDVLDSLGKTDNIVYIHVSNKT
jgi:Leucine-rich repeat (LRR) protein